MLKILLITIAACACIITITVTYFFNMSKPLDENVLIKTKIHGNSDHWHDFNYIEFRYKLSDGSSIQVSLSIHPDRRFIKVNEYNNDETSDEGFENYRCDNIEEFHSLMKEFEQNKEYLKSVQFVQTLLEMQGFKKY